MNHLKGFNKLGRNSSHRKALYRNMCEALFRHERIKTTTPKAKEIRRIAEKMISRAKDNSLHNIRIVNKKIKNKEILMKLFNEIAPRYIDRNGGYTRITKLKRRKGDGAELAYIELIEEGVKPKKKKKKTFIDKIKKEDAKTEVVEVKEDTVKNKADEEGKEEKTDEKKESE